MSLLIALKGPSLQNLLIKGLSLECGVNEDLFTHLAILMSDYMRLILTQNPILNYFI